MTNLAVLFGGLSNEHEISCLSAASVLRNIDHERFRTWPVGITREGRWFLYENADPDRVQDGSWIQHPSLVPVLFSPDRSVHGLYLRGESGSAEIPLDCVFPVLHGAGGEDGTIQGLCQLAGIPCVGPGVAASANSFDKSLTKAVVERIGVRQAACYLAQADAFARDPQATAEAAAAAVGSWPVFIKPCSSGSSVGVTAAHDVAALCAGLEEAFRWDGKALVEEYIDGREIEVAVLGNQQPVASVAGEIAPTQDFYTFDAKYHDETSQLFIPARIPDEAMERVREYAVRIFAALGCRGLSRVDFFCTYRDNEIIFNGINTIPGFTSISMYPKLFDHAGISFTDLISRLVDLAMEDAAHG